LVVILEQRHRLFLLLTPIQQLLQLPWLPQGNLDKARLFALMEAFLRDHKAKKAYAS
jgi:hypothetical protein